MVRITIVAALLSMLLACASKPVPICAESGHAFESVSDVRAMGWRVSNPLSVQTIEQEAMEERRAYAKRKESRKDVPMVPFGFAGDRWVEFKTELGDGDEIRRITTPEVCWNQLAGWDGFVLIRRGKFIKFFMTLIS